jgi:hypothetical protein
MVKRQRQDRRRFDDRDKTGDVSTTQIGQVTFWPIDLCWANIYRQSQTGRTNNKRKVAYLSRAAVILMKKSAIKGENLKIIIIYF